MHELMLDLRLTSLKKKFILLFADLVIIFEDAQEFSPEAVRPFPKAGPRKENKRGGRRRQVKFSVLVYLSSHVQ
jgi:hypothetical protein